MPIGSSGPDFVVEATTSDNQYQPSVAVLADGRFVMTWSDRDDSVTYDVGAAVFYADGTPAGANFVVATTGVGNQLSPCVSALSDGRFVIVWQSNDNGGDYDIRARVFNADGSPSGAVNDDFLVSTTTMNDQSGPSVTTLADGGFVVTWMSDDHGDGSGNCIRGRLFNADGSAIGDDFILNSTTASDQSSPSITTLADGRFVVTWESLDNGADLDIRARVFNADGSPDDAVNDGDDFLVGTTMTDDQSGPSVTTLADGGFVVTWMSEDVGDGSGNCLRGRVFSADGSAAGDDFLINSTAASSQMLPAVAALADGRFVVTWQSYDTGADYDIRGRVFNADGSPAGDDFLVSSTTALQQYDPAVTALADGRFIVTWYSYDDSFNSHIRARTFDPSVFNGTAGEDHWQGGNLTDRIAGGGGDDTFSGLGGDDFISGDAGNDMLAGGAGADRLFGGADNDTLNGGTGADRMYGGVGNDTYVADSAGDIVSEAGSNGFDRVNSWVALD
jgi:hypothetical protein